MSNTNYQKYLKYKLKYLELKNELEGGDNELEGGYNDDELEGGVYVETEEDKLKKEIIELFEGIKIEYGNLEKELAQVKAQLQPIQQRQQRQQQQQVKQPIRSNNPLLNELKQLQNILYKDRTPEQNERILEILNTKY